MQDNPETHGQAGSGAREEARGVPLGGIGAGCIEMGRDGRARNITINNNRTPQTRIPLSEGAFLAVRTARKGVVYARILQPDSSLPFADAGIVPPYTPLDRFSWRGLYPCSYYRLSDHQSPLNIKWMAMSPIIPYDVEASSMPAFLVAVDFRNPTDQPFEVSAVFNWVNLRGCVRDSFAEDRGTIKPVFLARDETQPEAAELEEDANGRAPRKLAGMQFGDGGPCRHNADGHYCLLAAHKPETSVSIMAWDEINPAELDVFWRAFHDEGRLGNLLSRGKHNHSGAVCSSFTLPPGKTRSAVFALAWYCPKFAVGGADMGNNYTNKFANALEVAARCVEYHTYYVSAVEDWQGRFLKSSLPRWFSKMLINNNYVLSTNALFDKDGRFAMMESPERPETGVVDRRLYSSLATLLFYPFFEEQELSLFAKADGADDADRICRTLGTGCMHEPAFDMSDGALADAIPKFVLMAYRNYYMRGNLARLDGLFPALENAMARLLRMDSNGDGLPEESREGTAAGTSSYTASLWIAAVRAYARLARQMDRPAEAERHEGLLLKAIESFERRFWSEEDGCYRHYDVLGEDRPAPPETPHKGQLAGQWYADFLCLGRLFKKERIDRAIETMWRLKGDPPDAAKPDRDSREAYLEWPAFDMAHFACLLIAHARTDPGLYSVKLMYEDVHVERASVFNQPALWPADGEDERGAFLERHIGSLAVWHVFYALEGFFLNLPEQTLWIRPNLPLGVHNLSAPLFTSSCFGWLDFQERRHDDTHYHQRLKVTFDSPIRVKRIVLRVPLRVEVVEVECTNSNEPIPVQWIMSADDDLRRVIVLPAQPIVVTDSPLSILVREREEPEEAKRTGRRLGKRR